MAELSSQDVDKILEIRDFFTHLLGLGSPWIVKGIVLDKGPQRVDVYLECAPEAQFPCPRCGQHYPVCDYSQSRTWRHLDACGKATYLRASLPTICCSEHRKQLMHPPWGDRDSSLTSEFEQFLTRLACEFGDIRKAAHFLGLEQVHLNQVLRRGAKEADKVKASADDALKTASRAPAKSSIRQPSLFEQNDMSFVNRGILAFRNMELEKAVEFLQKHRTLYPKGYDVTSRLAVAEFLLRGLRGANADPADRPAYLCHFWNSLEHYVKSEHAGGETYIAEIKSAFFAHVIDEIEQCSAGASALPAEISLGYVLLQAGRYEEAIRSLQDSIAHKPNDAVLYGRLGDAYWLRGDPRVARQCYREACLIDSAAIDWLHLRDQDLNELRQELLFVYGGDPELTDAWLPGHARINRLFERKVVHVHDGLKQMIDDYLELEKAFILKKSPLMAPKLFFVGMLLCENEANLKFIKKIDLIRVRRMMKQANPDLFADFLQMIAEGEGARPNPTGRR